jgi:hypothetical protein
MIRALLTGVVLAAVGAVPAIPAPPAPVAATPDAGTFVYDSVLTGLTEDGTPPAVVVLLAKQDDFVPKCLLCDQTKKALTEYGKLKDAPAAKQGKGLPEDLAKRLKSDKDETRRTALRELVDRYVTQAYARGELTTAQKTELEKKLLGMRYVPKDPNGGLPNGLRFCPSCDGACRVQPKL